MSEPFSTCGGGGVGKRQLENKVIVKGLRVKKPVISQNLVVQPDTVLVAENSVQSFFSVSLSSAPERILQNFSLWMPSSSMILRSSTVGKGKILVNFVDILADCTKSRRMSMAGLRDAKIVLNKEGMS